MVINSFSFIHSMTSLSLFEFPVIPNGMGLGFSKLVFIFSMIPVLIIVEWLQRSREYALSISFIKIKAVRWLCTYQYHTPLLCYMADLQNLFISNFKTYQSYENF